MSGRLCFERENYLSFSSRCDFVFLPLLLLSSGPATRSAWHLAVRLAVRASAGLFSLFSYSTSAG
jgi:hypothetical protein